MSVKKMIKLAVYLNYKYDLESRAQKEQQPDPQLAVGNDLVISVREKLRSLGNNTKSMTLNQQIDQFKAKAMSALNVIIKDLNQYNTYTPDAIKELKGFIVRAKALEAERVEAGLY